MIMMILNALAPVFFVMGMGYYAGYIKRVDNTNVKTLNLFVMRFALPSALFTAIAHTPRDVIVGNGPLMGVLAISMLVFYVIFFLMQRRLYGKDIGESSMQTLTAALPNYASVGLPLLGAVYGPSSALSVAVAIAVGATTVSPLTLFFLSSASNKDEGSAAKRFFHALSHTVGAPIVWGPLAGLLLALSGFQLPDIANRCFNLVGMATAGGSLFLTGLILSSQRLRLNSNVIFGVLIKNLLQPVLAYGVVRLLGIPDPIGAQSVMLVAIPAGFFGMVFGAAHNVKSEEAGSTLVISSVLSMVTLAVAIMVLAPQ